MGHTFFLLSSEGLIMFVTILWPQVILQTNYLPNSTKQDTSLEDSLLTLSLQNKSELL